MSGQAGGVFSGLYQPIHDAVRAALDEAAKVAREHESAEAPDRDLPEMIATAIEALKK